MIEIRVHGMGDHAYGSALGSPPVVAARYPDMPDTAVPPTTPPHPVRLINWSRTSRRALRLLWYLALPFTLVNLMGFMTPAGDRARGARIALRVAVVTVGIVLNVTVLIWVVAIGETIMRPLQFARDAPQLAGDVNVIVVTALLCVVVAVRWVRGRRLLLSEQTPPELTNEHAWLGWTSVVALATLIATGGLVLLSPPTSWRLALPLLSVPTPINVEVLNDIGKEVAAATPSARLCLARLQGYAFEDRLDPLNAVVALGLIVAIVVWLVLMLGGGFGRSTARGPMSGAALVSVLAVISLNAFGATLRLGLDWLMVYLDNLGSLGWINGRRTMSTYGRHIIAYQGQRVAECRSESGVGFVYSSSYYVDSLPLFMILGGIALGIAFWVVNHGDFTRLWTQRRETGRRRLLLFSHIVVTNLERRLGPAMIIALPVWVVLCAVFWFFVDIHAGPSTLFFSDLVKVIAQATAILVVTFVVFGGRMGPVTRVLSTIADIAGFWDTCYHPLAGDTYRHKVLKGISNDIQNQPASDSVVLVGHSQGSVLTAWFVARYEHRDLALVTCGTPLASLYGLFFPRYFGGSFLHAANGQALRWRNLWRATDPIATPLLTKIGQGDHDIQLDDPPFNAPFPIALGHSDYWTDPVQMAVVAELGRETHPSPLRKPPQRAD